MKVVCFYHHDALHNAVRSALELTNLESEVYVGKVFDPETHGAYLKGRYVSKEYLNDAPREHEVHPDQELFRDTITFACMQALYEFDKEFLEAWVSIDFKDEQELFEYPKRILLYLMVNKDSEKSIFFQPEGNEYMISEIFIGIEDGFHKALRATKETHPHFYESDFWTQQISAFFAKLVKAEQEKLAVIAKDLQKRQQQLLLVSWWFLAPISIIGAFIFLKNFIKKTLKKSLFWVQCFAIIYPLKDKNMTNINEKIEEEILESELQDLEEAQDTVQDQDGSTSWDENSSDEVAKLKEQLARTQADYANFKMRSERDRQDMIFFLKYDIFKKILPRIDDLERMIKNTPEEQRVWALYEAILAQEKAFKKDLENLWVVAFESLGQEVDPDKHEVMTQIPSGTPWVIVDEFEKWYMLGERVLRVAKVIVGM